MGTQKQKLKSLLIARILIATGIFLLLCTAYLMWLRYSPQRLAFKKVVTTVTQKQDTNPPEYIEIPALHINLPIYPSTIHNNVWETTTEGVSYWTRSPAPGEKGNSILYGHNWTSLLGNLIYSQPGQEIIIEYKDRTKRRFIIDKTAIVPPSQIHILEPSSDTRITIYTCAGFLDSKRFVAVALVR